MEINWNYCKSNDEIVDENIIKCIEKSKEEILQENDIAIIEDFSSVKNNILNWYNFKVDAQILEINTNLGGITSLLSKKSERLVATCNSKSIAKLLEKKYNKIKNLKLYVGEIKDIDIKEQQFDYIIIYNLKDIEYVRTYLKEDGIVLLMIDNKFSISAFAGAKPKDGKIFETIMENNENTASKKQIEKVLKQNNFEKYNFYYPLPNYRMANVIFSERYMPHENTTKLMYNICYRNGSAVVFDELKALKQITKEGKFEIFTNSYLVEINNYQQNQPKFISFNNTRKPQYRLMTKIYDNYVEKSGCFKESKEQINNIERNSKRLKELGFNIIDEREKDNIKCRYIELDTFDKVLAKKIFNGQVEEAYELIEKWYKYITERLVTDEPIELNLKLNINSEYINELTMIKNGYLDIVFENIFLENDEFILFDQEWYIEGIPVEFILYRAINNLYVYNQEINKIVPYEEMMHKFKFYKYIDIYKAIEKYIQTDVIDEKMDEVNKKSLNQLVDINKVSLMQNEINDYKENDKKRAEYIKELEIKNQDTKNKEEYIKKLENQIKEYSQQDKKKEEYIKYLEQKITSYENNGESNKEINIIKKFLKGSK